MQMLRSYVAVCRPDHWFKNVFMLAGTIAALLYPAGGIDLDLRLIGKTLEAFVITCLAASANYIVNEILDAERDKLHPTKRHRPVPSERVRVPVLWVMAAGCAGVALFWAWSSFQFRFLLGVAALVAQGLLYNVPPVRLKEIAYLDVLAESVNNPIRLLIGWYATGLSVLPPLSLFFGYWVFGGFLMSAKRFAEFRFIGDPARAAAYRSSFRGYSEESLLITMICYASLTTFSFGVLLVRYQLFDLFLSVPFVIGFLAWFFHLAFRPDSIVKEPERLYEAPRFALYCVFLFGLIVVLIVADLGIVWQWLNELRIGPPLPRPL